LITSINRLDADSRQLVPFDFRTQLAQSWQRHPSPSVMTCRGSSIRERIVGPRHCPHDWTGDEYSDRF